MSYKAEYQALPLLYHHCLLTIGKEPTRPTRANDKLMPLMLTLTEPRTVVMNVLNARPWYFFFTTLFLALFSQLSTAQLSLSDEFQDPEFLPVEQAYQLSVLEVAGEVALNWKIEPGYYLYKHAFKINSSQDFNITSPGVDRVDEYFGEVTAYYNFVDLIPTLKTDTQQLTVVSQGCADAGLCYPPRSQRFEKTTTNGPWQEVDEFSSANSSSSDGTIPTAQETSSLFSLIALAFIGGLILNLMPCVLPVLTLKSLSFATTQNTQERIIHGWAYTAGVVVSFLAIALTLILLKEAGSAVGWGFQLQSPLVVAGLIYLFFTIGLNLLGVFEFSGTAISGDNQEGVSGAFMTGVLACVVASPCTAPFMGTAVGAALSLPTAASLSIFAALGFGMALPFLLLSYIPSLGRFLPKPGNWMNSLKEFLAFPMFATAIWLLWVATYQVGANGIAIILGICLLLSIVYWWRKQLGLISLVALFGASILLSTPIQTQQQSAQQDFNINRLDQLVATGEPVFVNVTASWCITCKANERVAIKTEATQQSLNAKGINYVVADWTNYNPEISLLLERYNRNGIPLYLLFTNGNITSPVIFPQILTESALVNAFEKN